MLLYIFILSTFGWTFYNQFFLSIVVKFTHLKKFHIAEINSVYRIFNSNLFESFEKNDIYRT